jgi:hypothetical protein
MLIELSCLLDFQSGVSLLNSQDRERYKNRLDEAPGIFNLIKPIIGSVQAYSLLSENFDTHIFSMSSIDPFPVYDWEKMQYHGINPLSLDFEIPYEAPWNYSSWDERREWVLKNFNKPLIDFTYLDFEGPALDLLRVADHVVTGSFVQLEKVWGGYFSFGRSSLWGHRFSWDAFMRDEEGLNYEGPTLGD